MANSVEKTPVKEGQLKTVKINDFRCLEEVTLDMSEIVALKGNNESGKTSIIKALELLMLGGTNAGKYIRSGCRDFRVAGYVDGIDTTVVRTAKGYKVYKGDVTEKSAEKNAKPVAVVEKLTSNATPEIIENIFNLKRNAVTGSMLGSRGYNGIVPFVQTTSSENYSIVSEEMGVKPFRDAAYGGILEAGRLEKKAKILASQVEDLQTQQRRAEEAVNKAENMETLLGDKGALYDAVIKALESLVSIERIEAEVEGKPVGEAPEQIDVALLDAIEKVKKAASTVKEAKKTMSALTTDKEVPEPIDIELLSGVLAVKTVAKKRKECMAKLSECDVVLSSVMDEIKQYGEEISTCPVCGAVLVDGRCVE